MEHTALCIQVRKMWRRSLWPLNVTVKDIIQMVVAKFVHAFLPDEKKP
jgi:hypothetical protein